MGDPRARAWAARTRAAAVGGTVAAFTGLNIGLPNAEAAAGSFNGRLRHECLNEHESWSLKHARVPLERFRNEYNTEHLTARSAT